MDLVIDRTKWLRGGQDGDSMLLNPANGKMCCLGFLSLACDLTEDEIKDRMTPGDVPKTLPSQMAFLHAGDSMLGNSRVSYDLMDMNDRKFDDDFDDDDGNSIISDEERESRLTKMFAQHDINVTFVG